jgi:hypothetical protein
MKCHLHPDRDAVGYCVSCGQGVCAECKREVAGTIRCPAHVASVPPPVALRREKSRFATVVFSFLPGLGHIYLGAYQRGFGLMLIFAVLVTINSRGAGGLEPLFGVLTAFVWFFGIFDALRICRAINEGGADPGVAGALAPAIPKASSRAGSLTWGVILIGIGGLIVADRYVQLDRFFDFVGDNIGFIFIALGVLLLGAYARRRGKEKDRALEATASPDASAPTTSSFLK